MRLHVDEIKTARFMLEESPKEPRVNPFSSDLISGREHYLYFRLVLPKAIDEIELLRAELETARALAELRGNEVARLAFELGTVKAQRDKLQRACRAALGTWCPHGNPGGDGADGETYQLCESAIALEPGR